MTIRLSPELEAMVQQDIATGAYSSADEFVTRAVTELHEREQWIAEHRDEIRSMIDEGWAQAERGELLSAEEARAEVDRRLRKHFDVRKPA